MDAQMSANERSCLRCGYRGYTDETVCPQCRGKLVTTSSVQARGGVLVICGIFLTVVISIVGLLVANVIRSGNSGRVSFKGTQQQMLMIFGIFGLVFAFGLASIISGVWLLVFGKRNKVLTGIVIALGALFYIAGYFFAD